MGYLTHGSEVHDHFYSIQGSRIPVSLGILNAELPYSYDAGIYFTMLFLGWAG